MNGFVRYGLLAACAALGLAGTAGAAARPVVVELFTSQACSDCPPADALLRRLQAGQPGILALDLHVTYFNNPAWTDPFSSKATTARQNWYASLRHTTEVYTPQAVVDGGAAVIGSDRGAVLGAIAKARSAAAHPAVAVTIMPEAGGWRVALNGGKPARPATIDAFRYDAIDRTAVRGGENAGAKLTEIHVVRSIAALGRWDGQATTRHVDADGIGHLAVLVQARDGTILGAASR
ncbi:MAG: DUF1223 domain-containing protein [Acidiphilium sp.]